MEIINKSNEYNVRVKDIGIGNCFIYDGVLYMVVDEGYIDRCEDDKRSFPTVVLDLETNKLDGMNDNILVSRVNAKIVVE